LTDFRKALSGGSSSKGFSLPKPKLPKRRGNLKDGIRSLSKNVSDVAKQADKIGQRVSKTANAVQQVSETANNAAKKA
jgi:methyl-accepting chemotaxis protein